MYIISANISFCRMRKNLFLIRSFIRLHIIYMFLKAIHILKNKGILQWNFLSYKQTNCITVQCPIPAQCSIFISLKTPKNEMFSVVLREWNISTNMLKIGKTINLLLSAVPFSYPLGIIGKTTVLWCFQVV